MRSSTILSLFALSRAVVVTETAFATYYVTVDGNGNVIEPAHLSTYSVQDYHYHTKPSVTTSTSEAPAVPTTTSTSLAPPPAPTTTSVVPVTTSTSSSSSSSSSSTTSTSTTSSAAPPSSTLNAFQKDIVDYHNRVRADHHVGPVEWNDELASFAQNYLNGDNCVFKHSGGPYGENIALGYPTIDAALDAWYFEEDQYDYAAGQFSEATGHFTQMVWKDTSQVGCATYDCSGRTFLVCEYRARGNVIGWFTKNVFPK